MKRFSLEFESQSLENHFQEISQKENSIIFLKFATVFVYVLEFPFSILAAIEGVYVDSVIIGLAAVFTIVVMQFVKNYPQRFNSINLFLKISADLIMIFQVCVMNYQPSKFSCKTDAYFFMGVIISFTQLTCFSMTNNFLAIFIDYSFQIMVFLVITWQEGGFLYIRWAYIGANILVLLFLYENIKMRRKGFIHKESEKQWLKVVKNGLSSSALMTIKYNQKDNCISLDIVNNIGAKKFKIKEENDFKNFSRNFMVFLPKKYGQKEEFQAQQFEKHLYRERKKSKGEISVTLENAIILRIKDKIAQQEQEQKEMAKNTAEEAKIKKNKQFGIIEESKRAGQSAGSLEQQNNNTFSRNQSSLAHSKNKIEESKNPIPNWDKTSFKLQTPQRQHSQSLSQYFTPNPQHILQSCANNGQPKLVSSHVLVGISKFQQYTEDNIIGDYENEQNELNNSDKEKKEMRDSSNTIHSINHNHSTPQKRKDNPLKKSNTLSPLQHDCKCNSNLESTLQSTEFEQITGIMDGKLYTVKFSVYFKENEYECCLVLEDAKDSETIAHLKSAAQHSTFHLIRMCRNMEEILKRAQTEINNQEDNTGNLSWNIGKEPFDNEESLGKLNIQKKQSEMFLQPPSKDAQIERKAQCQPKPAGKGAVVAQSLISLALNSLLNLHLIQDSQNTSHLISRSQKTIKHSISPCNNKDFQQSNSFRAVSLKDIISSLRNIFIPASSTKIEFHFINCTEKLKISTYPELFKQILMNLINICIQQQQKQHWISKIQEQQDSINRSYSTGGAGGGTIRTPVSSSQLPKQRFFKSPKNSATQQQNFLSYLSAHHPIAFTGIQIPESFSSLPDSQYLANSRDSEFSPLSSFSRFPSSGSPHNKFIFLQSNRSHSHSQSRHKSPNYLSPNNNNNNSNIVMDAIPTPTDYLNCNLMNSSAKGSRGGGVADSQENKQLLGAQNSYGDKYTNNNNLLSKSQSSISFATSPWLNQTILKKIIARSNFHAKTLAMPELSESALFPKNIDLNALNTDTNQLKQQQCQESIEHPVKQSTELQHSPQDYQGHLNVNFRLLIGENSLSNVLKIEIQQSNGVSDDLAIEKITRILNGALNHIEGEQFKNMSWKASLIIAGKLGPYFKIIPGKTKATGELSLCFYIYQTMEILNVTDPPTKFSNSPFQLDSQENDCSSQQKIWRTRGYLGDSMNESSNIDFEDNNSMEYSESILSIAEHTTINPTFYDPRQFDMHNKQA